MNKIVIALAAGFVAGILFAPGKGSVTRRKINDGFDTCADKLSWLVEKFTPPQDENEHVPAITSKMNAEV